MRKTTSRKSSPSFCLHETHLVLKIYFQKQSLYHRWFKQYKLQLAHFNGQQSIALHRGGAGGMGRDYLKKGFGSFWHHIRHSHLIPNSGWGGSLRQLFFFKKARLALTTFGLPVKFSFPGETPPLPDPAGPREDTSQVTMCAQHSTGSTRQGILPEPTSPPPVWLEPTSRKPQGLHLKQSRRSSASRPGPLSRRRDTRGAAHVAGRALGHVRQEAGPRSGLSQEFGIIPPPRAPAPPPHSVSKSFRAATTTRETYRSPFTSPPNSQKPRDLPANRARFPAAWRPRTRPGRRAGPPPRGAARGLLRKQASTSMLAQAGFLPLRASP